MLKLKFRCSGVSTKCTRDVLFWKRHISFYMLEKSLGTLKFYVADGKKLKLDFHSDFDDEGIQYKYSYGGVVLNPLEVTKSASFPKLAREETTIRVMFEIRELIEKRQDTGDKILQTSENVIIEKWK